MARLPGRLRTAPRSVVPLLPLSHALAVVSPPIASTDPQETREAAGTLLVQLGPQERAAVVLKDAFSLSLEEIADVLGTTVGAVKAALHRGRGNYFYSPEFIADVCAELDVPHRSNGHHWWVFGCVRA